jgi:Ca-activated chloride channel family protein
MAARSHLRLRPPARAKLLEVPSAAVLAAIRDGWRRDRKPANIVLVVDTSASMDRRGRLAAAKSGLLSFVGELSRFDRIGLVTSGAAVETTVPLAPSAEARPGFVRAVRRLFPNGALPVYPAIERALQTVRALRDPERINAVVVLSDGSGTSAGLASLLAAIRAESATEGTSVRIFTVAYGDQADARALRQIATASTGVFASGGPSDIKDVYRGIASYF